MRPAVGDEIAHDFGISTSSIKRWLEQAHIDDGVTDGLTSAEQNELVQLRRRNGRLEQEVEILRRATVYFAKDAAPVPILRGWSGRSRWAIWERPTGTSVSVGGLAITSGLHALRFAGCGTHAAGTSYVVGFSR